MADVSIKIQGLEELNARLAAYPDISIPILQRAVDGSQALLAKNTTRTNVPWKTGNLLHSFRFSSGYLMARWYPTAAYAAFVEEGTKPHVILPKSKQALYWPSAAHPVKKVNHPGTAPNPYMERIVAAAQPEIDALFLQAAKLITTRIAGV